MYWLYLENSKLTTSDQSVLIQVFYIKKTDEHEYTGHFINESL